MRNYSPPAAAGATTAAHCSEESFPVKLLYLSSTVEFHACGFRLCGIVFWAVRTEEEGAHSVRLRCSCSYSAVRRQFASPGDVDGAEQQVLNYSTTQRTLLPLLGMSIAFIQTGQWTDELYQAFKVRSWN